MTKVLNVIEGSYITFVSSVEYDKLHGNPSNARVINWEDSFGHSIGRPLKSEISKYSYEHHLPIEIFEIVYD